MKLSAIGLFICPLLLTSCGGVAAETNLRCASGKTDFVLLAHGGSLSRPFHSKADRRMESLKVILQSGQEAIAGGASAIDTVTLVVSQMEDSGIFNAGRGAIPNQAGKLELDASIMDGPSQKAGAVASVHGIKNPILGARFVMEQTKNVLFVGPSAERLLKDAGLEQAELQHPEKGERRGDTATGVTATGVPASVETAPPETDTAEIVSAAIVSAAIDPNTAPYGTVGAVALDRCGHLAAATSTGGFGSKRPGRVGDSPIIGAGTYANETVAVSATGHGEYFIRYAVAHDIYARMSYGGQSLETAAAEALSDLAEKGGKGGVIALDAQGNYSMPFSAAGMVRGAVGARIALDVRSY
ncbi:isoaspartyl peptidase/L-asparaginase family protein [Pelagibius sp. Alg239-R121]|uniref:isoaspartyl peptidase/L-asparaginase family protein n=1 Tax=Pelagibius sp. Alg239-R121 TaxID=2993448 RepID=UPI0024A6E575|nr:isoaspartyl peptidase/L-asparaginase [Pelagibius sp. Alg239-R121]